MGMVLPLFYLLPEGTRDGSTFCVVAARERCVSCRHLPWQPDWRGSSEWFRRPDGERYLNLTDLPRKLRYGPGSVIASSMSGVASRRKTVPS